MRFRLWSSRRAVDRRGDKAVDAALAAYFRRAAPEGAERVLARLRRAPLPPQRRGVLWWWPSPLLTSELSPAWTSVAALACAALIGFGIGSFVKSPAAAQFQTAAQVLVSDADFGNAVFDYDPINGVRH
jgi:hypothetical protein